jgi:hypothetical protein
MFVGGRSGSALGLVLAVSLLLSPAASAQTARGDWSAVKAVETGSKLSVKLKTGRTVEGRLAGVTDDSLSLSVGGGSAEIKPQEIQRVYRVGGSSAKSAALVGLAVGAGAGAAVGAAGGGDDGFAPTRGQLAAGLAVLGAGAGALVGYAVGRGRHKRILIYQAAQP